MNLNPSLTRRDDLLWLAGVTETTGALDCHRGRYPRLRFAATDRDVIGRVATLIGAKVRVSLKPAPFAGSWHCEVSGRKAAEAMRALLPFMGARRSAEIVKILGAYEIGTAAVPQRPMVKSLPGPEIVRPPALR